MSLQRPRRGRHVVAAGRDSPVESIRAFDRPAWQRPTVNVPLPRQPGRGTGRGRWEGAPPSCHCSAQRGRHVVACGRGSPVESVRALDPPAWQCPTVNVPLPRRPGQGAGRGRKSSRSKNENYGGGEGHGRISRSRHGGNAGRPRRFAGAEEDLERRRRGGEQTQLGRGRRNRPRSVAAPPISSATRAGSAPVRAPDVPEPLTGASCGLVRGLGPLKSVVSTIGNDADLILAWTSAAWRGAVRELGALSVKARQPVGRRARGASGRSGR